MIRYWSRYAFLSFFLHGVLIVGAACVWRQSATFAVSSSEKSSDADTQPQSSLRLEWRAQRPSSTAQKAVKPEPQRKSENENRGTLKNAHPNHSHNPAPPYPEYARQRGWEGIVKIRVHIDEQGRVQDARVVKSSGYDILDRSALKTVRHWLFHPARIGSTPIASTAIVPIRFELD
ncbi:MAG: energy transducer TonB [Verrucomicrobiota bacterium]